MNQHPIANPAAQQRAHDRWMNARYGKLSAVPAQPLPTWRSDNVWGFPPIDWRKGSVIALAAGAVTGWLARGLR